MRNAIILCVAIIGFVAVPVTYSTVKGYTVWYWRNPHAQMFVNGHRVSGYVHRSKHGLVITRGDLPKRQSYIVSFLDQGTANITDCRPWSAPAFFVFVIRDIDPPCLTNQTNSETLEGPWGPVRIDGTRVEFQTTNNKVIRVIR